MKLVAHMLRLKLPNIFEEQVYGTLQEVCRNIHCHNILILKVEEWLPSGKTQQFQGLETVGTHVTDSGNNLQSSILACAKNITKRLALQLPQLK